MKKIHIKLFGGKHRYHPPRDVDAELGDFLEQFPEANNSRLNEKQLDTVATLRAGFSSLSDMQKRIILIMVDQNLSERAAAKVLGIHYGTLLTHLKRARKKLQKYVMQHTDVSIDSDTSDKGHIKSEAETNESDNDDTNEND